MPRQLTPDELETAVICAFGVLIVTAVVAAALLGWPVGCGWLGW